MDALDATDRSAVDEGRLAVVNTVGDLSVVTTGDQAASNGHPNGDGGDVARDPDAIAREIEQTRAELADTIDAITDRISPKKAAARGVSAVRAHVPGGTPDGSTAGASGTTARHAANSSSPAVPIAAVAGVVVLVLLFIRKRRRR